MRVPDSQAKEAKEVMNFGPTQASSHIPKLALNSVPQNLGTQNSSVLSCCIYPFLNVLKPVKLLQDMILAHMVPWPHKGLSHCGHASRSGQQIGSTHLQQGFWENLRVTTIQLWRRCQIEGKQDWRIQDSKPGFHARTAGVGMIPNHITDHCMDPVQAQTAWIWSIP